MDNKYSKIIVLAIFIFAALLLFTGFKNRTNSAVCSNCNVIIVGYDTVAAKHVSSLGYDKETTPNLDAIAAEGFSFANNISPAPWTVPAFMSLFTGLYPTEHKVINKFSVFNSEEKTIANLKKLSPNAETLAQVFKKNGYVTGGFTGDAGVSAQFGDGIGFDVYTDDKTFGSIENSSKYALDWLNKNKGKKFFMFLHGYDAHGQFKTPEKYQGTFTLKNYSGKLNGTNAEEAALREEQLVKKLNLTGSDVNFLNGIYDSKIKDGDARFGEFWSELKKMGLDRNTVVVILSDHGEEFYEHGGIDHGHTLYDELVHVPLVFKVPGMKGGMKITDQVTSLDVAPTLFDILGIKPDQAYQSQMRGASLLPFMQGKETSPQDIFMETDYRDFTHKRGIRTADGWKYILTMQTNKAELYNIKADPGELRNVANDYPEIASALDKRLRDHILSMGDNPDKKWTIGCLPVYPEECK